LRRREFITFFGAAATALPFTASAQQQMPLVGFLNSASPNTYRFNADSFREGLAKAGFVEGRNVRIEECWARADYERLPALAAELITMGVAAIAATGDVASARAAQQASSTVPVVFTIGGDPVRFGLVKSLNRPGGHVTGVLFNQNVLGAKRVELLRQIAPNVSRVALLMNPTNPNVKNEQADAETGAKKLGLETITLNARNKDEINAAFEQFLSAKGARIHHGDRSGPPRSARADCLVRAPPQDPGCAFRKAIRRCGRSPELWPEHQLDVPPSREYVGQILKGSNPAEMPVLQPTQFELVINLKTAKDFGLIIPPALVARADEVIE
jgi:putative tryptophan/tyrosine transport system substrate-binding protein